MPAIKTYIDNFTSTAVKLIEHYGIEGELKPTADQSKWLFNMMLYGGGFTAYTKDAGTKSR